MRRFKRLSVVSLSHLQRYGGNASKNRAQQPMRPTAWPRRQQLRQFLDIPRRRTILYIYKRSARFKAQRRHRRKRPITATPSAAPSPPRDGGDKEQATIELLRQRIAGGVYPPGAPLPTRRDLVRTLGVSLITVQRAMEQMEREGFIVSQGAAGTRVAEHPPHLSRFGVLFLTEPLFTMATGETWSQFNWAIKMAAESLERSVMQPAPRYRFSFHYGVFPGDVQSSPEYHRLMVDLRAGRLAGLIVTMSHILSQRAVLEPGVPAVLLAPESVCGVPCVYPDLDAFLCRAVAHVAGLGRRRLAWLGMGAAAPRAHLASLSQEFGMTTTTAWQQVTTPDRAQEAACRLFAGPAAARPDALIIADDHLVQPASVGLLLAGLSHPQQVAVTAYANFPMPLRAFLPVSYLGFDACELVRRCMARLQQQRQGQPAPPVTRLAPQFESELPPQYPREPAP